jgi:hypothetical protein
MEPCAIAEIQISAWRTFQHYRKREVHWVKVYMKLLDTPEWRSMSPAARAFLLDLWLLAGKTLDGKIRMGLGNLAWRLRLREPEMREWLQEVAAVKDTHGEPKWILVSASSLLADGYPPASPEREGEREGEKSSPGLKSPEVAACEEPEEPRLSIPFRRAAIDAYRGTAGAVRPDRILGVLKRLVRAHGEADVLSRWSDYCKAGRHFSRDGKTWIAEAQPVKFLTPERFLDTYPEWGPR